MSDLSTAKSAIGAAYPLNAVESPNGGVEPLLSAERLRQDHLFGIPLVSAISDPITRRPQVIDDSLLNRYIKRAIALVERESKLVLFPMRFSQKLPYDRQDFDAMGYFRIPNKPVSKIISLTIRPADGNDIFQIPAEWIEMSLVQTGQINIVPINVASMTYAGVVTGSPGGAFFVNLLGQKHWIPAYWNIEYIAGFDDGNFPIVINEAIGYKAALMVLRDLAATHAQVTGRSLGIDGLSQSVSGPGGKIYAEKIELLQVEYDKLIGSLATLYGQKRFVGVI